MSPDPHSGVQPRPPSGGSSLDLDAIQGDIEIHLVRQLNRIYRWRAWFGWKAHTPNFQGVTRKSTLRQAKRHLKRLRRVDRTPDESIWA